jgi:sterol desaturase/sphingolipid hydroxylase (fatty acid hydroxylase superfamily)
MELLTSTETVLRLSCFIAALLCLAALETLLPRRPRRLPRRSRWPANLGVSVVNQLCLRLLLPASAIALATTGAQNQWGFLNRLTLPGWLELVLAVLLLDLVIYLQHRLYHRVPLLWRFHRMHHADTEFDVSTGIRFHPLSIVLSGFIKLGAVLLIGPSAAAVLVFEVLLNATSLFNHSNLRLPHQFDRVLRLFIVTPDMHRVHHSSDPRETDRNFGFNFPWWDRLLQTYRDQPALGHEHMEVGLENFRESAERGLGAMLTQPFRGGAGPRART